MVKAWKKKSKERNDKEKKAWQGEELSRTGTRQDSTRQDRTGQDRI